MIEIENAFCLNKNCKDYGVRNQGNISKRGKYRTIRLSRETRKGN